LIFNNGTSGQGNQTDNLVAIKNYLYKVDGSSEELPSEDPTDIDEQEFEKMIIYTYERNIFVAHDGSKEVVVRSIDGRVVYSGYDLTIPMSSRGIYLVSVDGETVKLYVP
jgi:hypothetical protein